MGRGNFRHNGEIGKEWYIDYDNYRMEDDETYIDNDLLYEDENEILRLITEKYHSFHAPEKKYGDSYWGIVYQLENSIFRIGIADNQWSDAIFIEVRDDTEYENLAKGLCEIYIAGIEDILKDYLGKVYVRNGAWMSKELV